MKKIGFLIAALALSLSAFPCRCHGSRNDSVGVSNAFNQSDIVAIGFVTKIIQYEDSSKNGKSRIVQMIIDSPYKGAQQNDTIEITSYVGGVSCGLKMKEGIRYLIYAYMTDKLGITIYPCSRSRIFTSSIYDDIVLGKLKNRTIIATTDSSKIIPSTTTYDHFDIVSLDYHKSKLQRIFVTIDTVSVNNTEVILSIICEIKRQFAVGTQTNISFFSEKKYADYKTALFMDDGHPIPKAEHQNWLNNSYLSEYQFDITMYTSYPYATENVHRKRSKIMTCQLPEDRQ